MTSLGSDLQKYHHGFEPFPNESQCPECKWFNTQHPDVVRICRIRDPKGIQNMLWNAKCKCAGLEAEANYREAIRWQESGIKPQDTVKTFDSESFHQSPNNLDMYQSCLTFSGGSLAEHILVLVGPTGSGKSHLLEAAARSILAGGRTARYEMAGEVVDRFRHTFSSNDSDQDVLELMTWYQSKHLLALDDIGLERATPFGIEILTRIVEERIRHKWRTIVSTNLIKEEMAERMGDRLASRLYATNESLGDVKLVISDANDYRSR